MTKNRFLLAGLALIVGMSLAFTGCGGGDDDDSPSVIPGGGGNENGDGGGGPVYSIDGTWTKGNWQMTIADGTATFKDSGANAFKGTVSAAEKFILTSTHKWQTGVWKPTEVDPVTFTYTLSATTLVLSGGVSPNDVLNGTWTKSNG